MLSILILQLKKNLINSIIVFSKFKYFDFFIRILYNYIRNLFNTSIILII